MLNVVIIGGGRAGFSAAIRLRLSGHAVTLLEKEEEFKEVSVSVAIDSTIQQPQRCAERLLARRPA